jgi:hypothetical protein
VLWSASSITRDEAEEVLQCDAVAGRGRGDRWRAMSERMTAVSGPGVTGVMDYGRRTRAEMLAQYRAHYEGQRAEAERALAMPDDVLTVETFLGPWAMKNREVVR